jgi:hypothetical protein
MRLSLIVGLLCLHVLVVKGQDARVEESQEPLPVCDVLQNLQKYKGKIITVRGYWNMGSLFNRCAIPLKTDNYEWPQSIYLSPTINQPGSMPEWKIDRLEWENALDECMRISHEGPVLATIVGILDAQLDKNGKLMTLSLKGSHDIITFGFGGQGKHPAKITVIKIKDIAVEKNKDEITPKIQLVQ